MGYYSDFTISLYDGSDLPEALILDISTISDYTFDLDSSSSISSSESIKWYESSDHMKLVSMKYPTLLIQVYRCGEESDDETMAYYLRGREEIVGVSKTFAPPSFAPPIGREFGTIRALR